MNLLDTASLVVTPNGYKASKLYSIIPSDGTGDMTFARTGDTATRVNSSGLIESVLANKPRLDYLGSTCPKLLLEPQRTNLLTYSNDFTNGWTPAGGTITVTSNYGISPDGTQNSTRLQFSSTNQIYTKTVAGLSGNVGTFSLYIKGTAGQKITITYGGVDKLITLLNGWNRYSNSSTATYNSVFISTYGGTTALDIEIYGGQVELGAYATSYIPTTTASVTRNADSCFKSSATALIGQTEGTIFFEGVVNNVTTANFGVFGLQKVSTNTIIHIGKIDNGLYAQCYNGSTSLFFNNITYTQGTLIKVAFAYKAGDYALYANGSLVATGTNATAIPSCDLIETNRLWTTQSNAVQSLNKGVIWKTRLQNSELATLTSL